MHEVFWSSTQYELDLRLHSRNMGTVPVSYTHHVHDPSHLREWNVHMGLMSSKGSILMVTASSSLSASAASRSPASPPACIRSTAVVSCYSPMVSSSLKLRFRVSRKLDNCL